MQKKNEDAQNRSVVSVCIIVALRHLSVGQKIGHIWKKHKHIITSKYWDRDYDVYVLIKKGILPEKESLSH